MLLPFIALGVVLLVAPGTQIRTYTAIKSELPAPQENKVGTTAASKKDLTQSINLNFAFQPQAPFGDWRMPYQESCEEAALILADHYYSKKQINPTIMKREILALIEWENKVFGYYQDTNSFEMARTWQEYFGHKNAELKTDFTLEALKATLLSGYPVIIPAAGRLLNNPYYTKPGPIYHALVVKGYSGNEIITHDVGTRFGKDFVYDAKVLLNAAHDFNQKNILNGKKVMIILRP